MKRARKERQPPLGRNGLSDNDQQRLRGFVQELGAALDERRDIDERIRDIKKSARAYGFDGATVALVLREKRMDSLKRQERDALADIYRHALGLLADNPLGQAALAKPARRPRGPVNPRAAAAPPPDATAADGFREGP